MTTLATAPRARTAAASSARPGAHLAADVWTMVRRCVLLVSRDVDSLVMGVALPVMLMVVFVYVFGGAIQAGLDGTTYLNYVTPGIVLLCAGFGAANTALAVQQDVAGGIVDRFRSMPVTAWTLLVGHVVASVVKNLVTTGVVVGVAYLMGFRPDATLAEWLGAVGIIVLWVVAITWAATFVGVVVRSVDAASAATFVMLFVPYVSSAFVPPQTMPALLRGFAEHQPVTPVIETIRGLLTGTELGTSPVLAVVWCVGIATVFAVLAGVVFGRRRHRAG
ncbi:ABC-2 type transport system permease protein [Sediminihabitans luteus]|uniref:Transport permease protein n=1 Tax=Sediminihabitans luteus TaxID=1138585 RepID=A0A2M9CCZ9_9CELL|nr:ABC transporter permease [Sediminihabitans luteus]PJJ69267.1 ABC-2 type transport system permease protein [Sediminihabitans luteus]GII98943.1 transport permease protein [Sediminihabitans luteus]